METGTRGGTPKKPAPRVAPYLDWAVRSGFRYQRKGDWLPLLVEFALEPQSNDEGKLGPLARFIRLDWLEQPFRTSSVRVPDVFAQVPTPLASCTDWNFCVLWIWRDHMADIVKLKGWRATIVSASLGPPITMPDNLNSQPNVVADRSPVLDADVAQTVSSAHALLAQEQTLCSASERVVIGVIDQGIAFAHQRFRNSTGTRIAFLWRQDALESGAGISPGVELNAGQIDAEVSTGRDEECIYRTIGGLHYALPGYKPLGLRRAHGTHVLDLAAGEAPQQNVADRPIIAVDMPEDAVGDPVGSTLTVHALLGILYILVRAEGMRGQGETLPVVINLSYGPYDGPHDGSTDFERAVDLIESLWNSTYTPVRFVFAGGNSRQARVRAHAVIDPGKAIGWQWRVQPEDRTPSFVELWFDAGVDEISVELTPPSGRTLRISSAVTVDEESTSSNLPLYRMSLQAPTPTQPRPSVLIVLAPTTSDPPLDLSQPTVPCGQWAIQIRNGGNTRIKVDGWVRRDETLSGRRSRGRQAYFDDPTYARFGSVGRPLDFGSIGTVGYVDRYGSLSGVATGAKPFVIGGYRKGRDQIDKYPTSYSSAGPRSNTTSVMKTPTCLFASDDSLACRGMLAAGTRSGSVVAMNGTSVAAPQATRWVAEQRASTGQFPTAPFTGLLPPVSKPLLPIPTFAVTLVAGDGLMPFEWRRERP